MDKNDRDYSNGEITVHWRSAKCIHSTICYSKLRKVFDPARRPWVNMHGASTDEIIEIVGQCPTDALTFTKDKKPDKNIQKKEEKAKVEKNEDISTKIQIIHNGPALISGNFTITDVNGSKLAKVNSIALCRCGKSSSMPFCDGTHNKSGFNENR